MEGWEESSSGPRKGVKGLIGRDWDNEGIGREQRRETSWAVDDEWEDEG
jgi:hypothetical protein